MTTEPGIAARIHDEIEQLILTGTWRPGQRIPTEIALTIRYGCARMTVHKALARLAARGMIVRRRRAGSFVATPSAEQAVMTIADFAEEARRTGRKYTYQIAYLEVLETAPASLPADFPPGEPLLSVHCLHQMDDLPVAWEERLIRTALVPSVTRTRFRSLPPGPWLLKHVPWTEAEHEITALKADAALADRLQVRRGAALLSLHRRTWHQGGIVTDVRFYFPGERYRFIARFSPGRPA